MSNEANTATDETTGVARSRSGAPNTIVELNAQVETAPGPTQDVTISPKQWGRIADALADAGADTLSARIEIERRHCLDNGEHVPRFTVSDLTEIATILSVCRTQARMEANFEYGGAIEAFGHVINRSEADVIDATATPITLPGCAPESDERVDPYRVLTGAQTLWFVDADGNRLTGDERDETPTV